MPERLTNDMTRFTTQVKKELIAPIRHAGNTTQAVYCEVICLMRNYFAIHYVTGNENKLCLRTWNSHYDMDRFSNGLYNLDRPAIVQKDIPLTSQQVSRIDPLLEKRVAITKYDGVVLDGVESYVTNHRLQPAIEYYWNEMDMVDEQTAELIRFLKLIANPPYDLNEKKQD
jgi:hypothetical protein